MDERWLQKQVRNCLRHYGYDDEMMPLSEDEWRDLCVRIAAAKKEHPNANVYELVHDAVYRLMTGA
ncbi:YqzH family protein [Geobacillus subterraneus]|uniref:YqzH family protein n=1 Tax=Geobacillus subterraneus TaxID=129338 RepID=UPI00160D498E